eukprot:Platyproteum_vivax@DN5076_c0_g1_i1.p1
MQPYMMNPLAAGLYAASYPGQYAQFAAFNGMLLMPDEDVARCHLHTKPVLTCKFCRKHKDSAKRVAQLLSARPTTSMSNPSELVEMTNMESFNLNPLLKQAIIKSDYFRSLFAMKAIYQVTDELQQFCQHAEPYTTGSNSRTPSTLYCCLFKMFQLKVTVSTMSSLLENFESPYIRCTGFLYLRYAHPPEKLWDWFEPYFLDDEQFSPGADKQRLVTVGEWVESLITEDKYFNTVLPRLPTKVKQAYGARLMTLSEYRKRKETNKQLVAEGVLGPGTEVDACSQGDWLEGLVKEVMDELPGRLSVRVKLEDGSEETLDVGMVIPILDSESESDGEPKKHKHKRRSRSRSADKKTEKEGHREHRAGERERSRERTDRGDRGDRDRSRERGEAHRDRDRERDRGDKARGDRDRDRDRSRERGDRDRRDRDEERERWSPERSASRSRSASREREGDRKPMTQEEAMRQFMKREQNKAIATGKDYARRPTSYKSSLSLRMESSTIRRRSPEKEAKAMGGVSSSRYYEDEAQERKKDGPSAEHQKKIAALMAQYNRNSGQNPSKRNKDFDGPDTGRLG